MAEKYTIVRESRGSISLQVTRQGEVVIKAPRFVPEFIINQFIASKKEWIDSALQKISVRLPKKRTYTEGEEFLYLGTIHKLSFHSGTQIIFKNGKLYFPLGAKFRIKKELEAWYKTQAGKIITERVIYQAKKMKAYYKDVFFSDTSSKWGTCFADNTLQFNWRLIMAPLMVIDYVVIHELTHTTEKHHQAPFWSRVRLFTPAYKQHRKWLADNAALLHF